MNAYVPYDRFGRIESKSTFERTEQNEPLQGPNKTLEGVHPLMARAEIPEAPDPLGEG